MVGYTHLEYRLTKNCLGVKSENRLEQQGMKERGHILCSNAEKTKGEQGGYHVPSVATFVLKTHNFSVVVLRRLTCAAKLTMTGIIQ